MKILIPLCVILLSNFSFGQDSKNSTNESIKKIDLTIEEGTYEADESLTADKLILNNSNTNKDISTVTQSPFNETDWQKTKDKILENRKRILASKEIFTAKIIDTVFVEIPSIQKTSRLSGSGW